MRLSKEIGGIGFAGLGAGQEGSIAGRRLPEPKQGNWHEMPGRRECGAGTGLTQDFGRVCRAARAIAGEAAGLFYPRRCPFCDDLLLPGLLVCDSCRRTERRVGEPVCKRCGKPLGNAQAEYCRDCSTKRHRFLQGKAVFVYRQDVRLSMYRFKYSNRREYALFYAKEAAGLYGGWVRHIGVEAILPVPMYEGKKRRRGYNQAEVFARALGRELGLPVDASLVRRVRDTAPQKELNESERRHNLKNAFHLSQDIVKYKKVLLADDIYTTGSTMDAVAEALLSGGINQIYCICISIGAGF